MKSHIVQKGDTLYSIAKQYHIKLKELLMLNPQITNPNKIEIGMRINVPDEMEESILENLPIMNAESIPEAKIETAIPAEGKVTEKEQKSDQIMAGGKVAMAEEEKLNFWQLPTQARPFIYIMKKGDTLNELAEKYHVSLKRLLELNPHIGNADHVAIGTKIFVPGTNESFRMYQPVTAGKTPTAREWEEVSVNVEVTKKEGACCPNCGYPLDKI